MRHRPAITQMEALSPEKIDQQRKQGLLLARKVERHLKGKHPGVTAVCLAELVSMWAVGHVVPGDAAATKTIRTAAISGWSQLMLGLIPINAKIIDAKASSMGLSSGGNG